jgi:hypothetical protein
MPRFGLKEALLAAGVSMASLGIGCGDKNNDNKDQVCEEEIFRLVKRLLVIQKIIYLYLRNHL